MSFAFTPGTLKLLSIRDADESNTAEVLPPPLDRDDLRRFEFGTLQAAAEAWRKAHARWVVACEFANAVFESYERDPEKTPNSLVTAFEEAQSVVGRVESAAKNALMVAILQHAGRLSTSQDLDDLPTADDEKEGWTGVSLELADALYVVGPVDGPGHDFTPTLLVIPPDDVHVDCEGCNNRGDD
jgi:hypothetical protein